MEVIPGHVALPLPSELIRPSAVCGHKLLQVTAAAAFCNLPTAIPGLYQFGWRPNDPRRRKLKWFPEQIPKDVRHFCVRKVSAATPSGAREGRRRRWRKNNRDVAILTKELPI
ncbi:hypothetical protein Zmor_012951 [Zophobas morio]|uniref:Uncharacterized protein n=1 Tax=Zophobas morio TaxID=2755281 RepID=A0AA38IH30_9CUCU|nr:hypothetical protein Zmor_012951 [Zophobas morio]